MTQHIPSLPANIDPRIAEILRQRAQKGVTIRETRPAPAPRPVPLPAGPAPTVRPVPLPDPGLQGQGEAVPFPPYTPTPSVQPQVVVLSDEALAGQLALVLPRIDALIRRAISNIQSDGHLSMAEAIALAPEVRNIVSQVIGEMLPQIKGQSAADLVALVLAVLIQQYISPRLPVFLRGMITTQLIRTMIATLQHAYETWVKPRLQTGR